VLSNGRCFAVSNQKQTGVKKERAMVQSQRFEIPQELRQLAEENVERARQLYLRFMENVEQAMAVWSAPASDMIAPGFGEVRERAAELAKQNAEAAFKLATDVANAKDLQELLTLQSHYVQSQMRWYANQTEEFGQLMATAFRHMQSVPEEHRSRSVPPGSETNSGGQATVSAPKRSN
jgi:hypothetical protein